MFLTGYNQPGYMGSYESRQDLMPPGSGPYERVVKQATYSVQSSDSKLLNDASNIVFLPNQMYS